jgi:ATP-dependent Clp protease ATP-binding subunit ClpA
MTPPPSLQELIETVRRDAATDDPLELLSTASSTAAALEELSDALLGHFVDRCRRGGRSWSEISAALGVSKQAVHKRFSGAIADRLIAQSAAAAPSMERFTLRARSAFFAATRAARSLGHDTVGTEHLLLGLYEEPDGLAAKALLAMNASRDSVEAAVLAARPRGAAPGGAAPGEAAGTAETGDAPQRLPFSEAATSALREAVAEALERGHNYIGTEHLLLGLYRMPDSLAARVLAGLGAGHKEAKVRLDEMLRGFSSKPNRPG